MKTLKVDLHLHTGEDPLDSIKYSSKQLIDKAYAKGFDVISITNHHVVTYNDYLADYAKERGILLIPGIELSVESKHVLVINADHSFTKVKNFYDLRKVKDKDHLFIAPHPFFPGYVCLHSKFSKHSDLFHAIEYSYFHASGINFNKKGVKKSLEYGIPLLGTSDTHRLWQLGKTYSVIESEKSTEAVIEAIKKNRVKIITQPLELAQMTKIGFRLLSDFNYNFRRHLSYSFNGNNGKRKKVRHNLSH
ncbi:MAG: PHP-associated domain-containing protein [Thermodesulfobacteriota bacterium]|nr:PHP-associated domain-containing protein [Thermodesulfobacteriota bacterium]